MTAYTHNTGAVINFDALAVGSVNATLSYDGAGLLSVIEDATP